MKYPFILLLTILSLAACMSPSDEITKAFKTVNASIKRSNEELVKKNAVSYSYLRILSKSEKHPQLAAKADSLDKTMEMSVAYLEVLKKRLLETDSVLEHIGPAGQLLVNTPASDSIRTMLINLAHHAYATPDSVLGGILRVRAQKDWANEYFREAPTVAALTILSKLQSDCLNSALVTFQDIGRHL